MTPPASPSTPPMVLSELLLKQALGQIKQVPTYDGQTEELTAFVRRVDYIMQLYPTQDLRQHNVLFGAIELQTSGTAQRVAQLSGATNWIQLRNALIDEFKTQTPYEELLRRLYNTNYNGSIRKFVEDLEYKSFVISNKLMLEGIDSQTILYTNAMNNTIKDVITRKLPDRIFMTLARYDITTITKLKQVAQREGLYENNFSDRSKTNTSTTSNSSDARRNRGNSHNFYPMASPPNTSNATQNFQAPNQSNPQLHNEFQQKLNQGRFQNPMNYQQNRTSTNTSNPPVKRQRESSSGQSKMDTAENFHHAASDQELEETPSFD